VSDREIMGAAELLGRTQGLFACPEGAATVAAFERLRDEGWIGAEETVVLFNTGTGLKYTHLWAAGNAS
jgi:threonine synthase